MGGRVLLEVSTVRRPLVVTVRRVARNLLFEPKAENSLDHIDLPYLSPLGIRGREVTMTHLPFQIRKQTLRCTDAIRIIFL